MPDDLRIVVFDLDDTLAPSKTQIPDRMARLLADLLDRLSVCIISGGKYEQFQVQVLSRLPAGGEQLTRLHLMPTCGTQYYNFLDGAWNQIYAEDLSDEEKARIEKFLMEGARELGLWEEHPWGPIIEDRGSQITYSALGQQAPHAEKVRWDPDGEKKRVFGDYMRVRLPELEVRGGGSTSLDITRKGVDKAYGMRKLMDRLRLEPRNLLFIGDRLDEAGNDYPVYRLGIPCVSVQRWEHTADVVDGLLGWLADPAADLPFELMPPLAAGGADAPGWGS